MKIQEGIEQGIDLIRSVNTDEIIQKFDKFQMILDGFRKEFPSLIGSENQIKAAEKIREKESGHCVRRLRGELAEAMGAGFI